MVARRINSLVVYKRNVNQEKATTLYKGSIDTYLLSALSSYNSKMINIDYNRLAIDIKNWAGDLGFQETAITDADLSSYQPYLEKWVEHFSKQRNLKK